MVDFAGWDMPVQYEGIVTEHRAVRESCGVFDISHMGPFEASGKGAGDWLNRTFTNDTARLAEGSGQYTLMTNEEAGVIDDLLLYRFGEERWFFVLNASRVEVDAAWLRGRCPGDVTLTDRTAGLGAIAVQGPQAVSLASQVFDGDSLPERNGVVEFGDGRIVCRTGYTGEDGFELFAPVSLIGEWFRRFIEAGAKPCGLGARDTLRLEKCLPLYGNDLDEQHTPLEAGLGRFVKLGKDADFPGRAVLLAQRAGGMAVRLAAIRSSGKAPPFRPGYPVLSVDGTREWGVLCSGGVSPLLAASIGLAYLPAEEAEPGNAVTVAVRGRSFPAEVVKKPFV